MWPAPGGPTCTILAAKHSMIGFALAKASDRRPPCSRACRPPPPSACARAARRRASRRRPSAPRRAPWSRSGRRRSCRSRGGRACAAFRCRSVPRRISSTCGLPVTQSTMTSAAAAISLALADFARAALATRSSTGRAVPVRHDQKIVALRQDVLGHAMAHQAEADEADHVLRHVDNLPGRGKGLAEAPAVRLRGSSSGAVQAEAAAAGLVAVHVAAPEGAIGRALLAALRRHPLHADIGAGDRVGALRQDFVRLGEARDEAAAWKFATKTPSVDAQLPSICERDGPPPPPDIIWQPASSVATVTAAIDFVRIMRASNP